MILALNHFEVYVVLSNVVSTVFSDHNPLVFFAEAAQHKSTADVVESILVSLQCCCETCPWQGQCCHRWLVVLVGGCQILFVICFFCAVRKQSTL